MSHYTSIPGTLLKDDYEDITIKVCGLETISTTLLTTPSYFYYYNTGSKYPAVTTTIDTWFVNNDVTIIGNPSGQDCPLVKYDLFSPFAIPYTDSDVNVAFSPPSSVLKINTVRNLKQSYWIMASTNAGKFATQQFDVWICGQEIVNVTVDFLEVFIPYYDPKTNNTIVNSLPPLIDSNDTICPIIQYDLFIQDAFTNLKIPYNDSNIWTNFVSK